MKIGRPIDKEPTCDFTSSHLPPKLFGLPYRPIVVHFNTQTPKEFVLFYTEGHGCCTHQPGDDPTANGPACSPAKYKGNHVCDVITTVQRTKVDHEHPKDIKSKPCYATPITPFCYSKSART